MLIVCAPPVISAREGLTENQTEDAIDREIREWRERIAAERNRIDEDRIALTDKIAELQREIDSGSEATANLESQLDALTNELAEIEARIERESQTAESLERFIASRPGGRNEVAGSGVPALDELFAQSMKKLRDGSAVRVETREVIFPGGLTREASVAFVGNIASFAKDEDEVYIVDSEADRLVALEVTLSSEERSAIGNLFEGPHADGIGSAPLDVTGSANVSERRMRKSFSDYFSAGGLVMYPLALVALAGLLISVERFVFAFRHKRALKSAETVFASLRNSGDSAKSISECRGKLGAMSLLETALSNASSDDAELRTELLLASFIPKFERGLGTLSLLASIAPLLGLLGTVTGMIGTFNAITVFGTSDPGVLSSGISEALITTQAGLVVAIPLLLFHSMIAKDVDTLIAKMEQLANDCLAETKSRQVSKGD
ncbi:MAG: MotA/TolQ/ExbB proton channel family protein [Planctomycetes bacterium]|nr:MotA/TolQ/ExbB proton channel family protein [Planctomycetota bacterium]